jgi:hypothetical protein
MRALKTTIAYFLILLLQPNAHATDCWPADEIHKFVNQEVRVSYGRGYKAETLRGGDVVHLEWDGARTPGKWVFKGTKQTPEGQKMVFENLLQPGQTWETTAEGMHHVTKMTSTGRDVDLVEGAYYYIRSADGSRLHKMKVLGVRGGKVNRCIHAIRRLGSIS